MSVSADMYIVISLMFAVFAAVSAVGTSVVLGAGFERLRAGFDVIKKQTGFFSDAIHQLDQRSSELEHQTQLLQESVAGMTTRVDRVEKQATFFFDAIHTMEESILKGTPIQEPKKKEVVSRPIINSAEKSIQQLGPEQATGLSYVPTIQKHENYQKQDPHTQHVIEMCDMLQEMDWSMTAETGQLLKKTQAAPEVSPAAEKKQANGLSALLFDYLKSDTIAQPGKGVLYH